MLFCKQPIPPLPLKKISSIAFSAALLSSPAAFAQQVSVPLKQISLSEFFAFEVEQSEERPLPEILNTQVFALEKPLRDGSNAITMFQFDRKEARKRFGDKPSFTSRIDEDKLEFNDLGEGADLEPGDGIFSAFSTIDFASAQKQQMALLEEISAKKQRTVLKFSGRSIADKTELSLDRVKEVASKRQQITLANGIRAIQFPLFFGGGTPLPFTANESKVLAINSTSVVANPTLTYDPCDTDGTGNDANPDAPWSFKTLISNLNQGTGLTDQEFTHQFLRNWMVSTNVNGFTIPARTGITDYFTGWNGTAASTLDMDDLPFRLLAITNRIDLAKVSYTGSNEGEIRFVFGLLDPNSCSASAGINQMTVIFEYGDTASSCSAIKNRVQEWLDLDSEVLGSITYLNKLKQITDDVTEAPQAATTLNQLRTNDFAFDGIGNFQPWQLREFVVGATSGLLEPTTTKQTPDASFRFGNPTTAQYWEQNANDILCESYVVPDSFLGNPFLGGNLDYFGSTFWNAPTSQANLPANFPICHVDAAIGVSPTINLATHIQSEVRHKFSINACDDCHARETDTFFTHINPVTRGLSGFMTGTTVADPLLGPDIMGGITRSFDDLQRRGQAMMQLQASFCGGGVILGSEFVQKTVPLNFVH